MAAAFLFTRTTSQSPRLRETLVTVAITNRHCVPKMRTRAKMVLETGKHPGELKDMVCSPGGTTIEGLAALEETGFRGAIIKACDANFEKNKKLTG